MLGDPGWKRLPAVNKDYGMYTLQLNSDSCPVHTQFSNLQE